MCSERVWAVTVRPVLRSLLALVAPPSCLACAAPVPVHAPLCQPCRAGPGGRAIPALPALRPARAVRGRPCPAARARLRPLVGGGRLRRPGARPGAGAQGARPPRAAAPAMAARIAATVPADLLRGTLVPVPPDARRLRARGVDHAGLLAPRDRSPDGRPARARARARRTLRASGPRRPSRPARLGAHRPRRARYGAGAGDPRRRRAHHRRHARLLRSRRCAPPARTPSPRSRSPAPCGEHGVEAALRSTYDHVQPRSLSNDEGGDLDADRGQGQERFPSNDELREHVERRFAVVSRQVSDLARLEVELSHERNPGHPRRADRRGDPVPQGARPCVPATPAASSSTR